MNAWTVLVAWAGLSVPVALAAGVILGGHRNADPPAQPRPVLARRSVRQSLHG